MNLIKLTSIYPINKGFLPNLNPIQLARNCIGQGHDLEMCPARFSENLEFGLSCFVSIQ